MIRLLVGMCVVAVAVFAVHADDAKKEDKKSVRETYQAQMKELVPKYRAAKSQEERDSLLTKASEKFVELAKKNPDDPFSVDILAEVMSFPLPDTKDGPKAQAVVLLKKAVDQNKDKAARGKALTAYLGAQEKILMGSKDPKAIAAAKKEMADYRKILKSEFKDLKDLYIGAKMPELKSKNLDDKEVKLSDLKGKVVVLDIWATWCPPCRAMIPHSRELVKKLKEKPFVLVSISADAKKETLTDFMKKNEMPWTHWWNGQAGGILTELGVQYFPTIYVLDSKGVIRYKDVREEAMDNAVETLLKEAEMKKDKTE